MNLILNAIKNRLDKNATLEVKCDSDWWVGNKRVVDELHKAKVRLELGKAGIRFEYMSGGVGMVLYRYPRTAEEKAVCLQGDLLKLSEEFGELCKRMEALRNKVAALQEKVGK